MPHQCRILGIHVVTARSRFTNNPGSECQESVTRYNDGVNQSQVTLLMMLGFR